MSNASISLGSLISPLISKGNDPMVIHDTRIIFLTDCGSDKNILGEIISIDVEALFVILHVVSGVYSTLAPLNPVGHGDQNKVGEIALRNS